MKELTGLGSFLKTSLSTLTLLSCRLISPPKGGQNMQLHWAQCQSKELPQTYQHPKSICTSLPHNFGCRT